MGRAFEYRRAAKEKRWDKMSKMFPKLGKAITMAAKEGGMDPTTNAKLRTAIQNAKSENMPKDNIESAIKRAAQKDIASFTEVNYEGKGPHGVLVYVECATDNPTRTVANVRAAFNKLGGNLGNSGAVSFQFDKKGVFKAVFNLDSKMLTVTYDPRKLQEIQLHNMVAMVGHDTEKVKASNVVYESLPDCCKYRQDDDGWEHNHH